MQGISRPTTVTIDGEQVRGTLTVEQQSIEVPPTMLPQPDLNWRYTDERGHEHHYDNGYPTLETVVTGTWWCQDCHEEHAETALACRQCGEHITPGTKPPSPFPTYVQGPSSWSVEVGRFYPLRTELDVEVGGMAGRATVVEAAMSSHEQGRATLVGITELSQAAPR